MSDKHPDQQRLDWLENEQESLFRWSNGWTIRGYHRAKHSANRFATAREFGEVKARLESLEQLSRQMRSELRSDIKELRDLIQRTLHRNLDWEPRQVPGA